MLIIRTLTLKTIIDIMNNKNQKLTLKQQRFCLEYLNSGNATQAAIKAGYSPKTARSIATENLSKLAIQDQLTELIKITDTPKIMSAIERKERLSELARIGNPRQTNPVEAIKELNRMSGDYPPERSQQEITVRLFFIPAGEYLALKKFEPNMIIDMPSRQDDSSTLKLKANDKEDV